MESRVGPNVIAALVIVGFVAAVTLMLVRPLQISGDAAQILNMLLGILGAKFGDVVSYHIGSSAGSRAKDAVVQTLTQAQKN